jgi:tRNA(Ile)-lysidine synthase
MFQHGDSVLVGVSGGPDSVALLNALISLAPQQSIHLGMAHLNHSLRGVESERDANFVSSLAEELHLPLYLKKVDVSRYRYANKLSVEEAARQLRYGFYVQVAEKKNYRKIALGHHADDNAELILMYLLRGSGPLGISGIQPVRDGKMVRPLIERTRMEIMNFLHRNNIEYVSDTSNTDTRYLRNKVRHHLIPHLRSTYNPNLIGSLNRLSHILRSEEDWIQSEMKPIWDTLVVESDDHQVYLTVQQLNGLHTAVKRRLLRFAIQKTKGDLKRITFSHIEKLRNLCEQGPRFGRLDFPDYIRVERIDTVIRISKETNSLREIVSKPPTSETNAYQYRIDKPGTVRIHEMGAHLNLSKISIDGAANYRDAGHMVAFFDINTVRFPLIIRNIHPGDRFTPLGMHGTQKVNDFFINNKVSRAERVKCPVLVSNGNIIWVMSHRIDDSVKITSKTRNVLRAELFLA